MAASLNLKWKIETDIEIRSSAEKFHHVLAARPHHVSKATPKNVQACELHQGEWGQVGAVICWKYVHDGKAKVAKEMVEAVEPEKNLIVFKVIDGDLMKEYKSFRFTIQVSPKPGGTGSVVHWTFEYEKLDHKTVHPETLVHFLVDVSKEIDDFLLSEK